VVYGSGTTTVCAALPKNFWAKLSVPACHEAEWSLLRGALACLTSLIADANSGSMLTWSKKGCLPWGDLQCPDPL
jgi:hypothetical protein